MSHFRYQNGELHAEGVALGHIAREHGTPCYVYSRAALTEAFRAFATAFSARDHLICYAVKANSSLAVLNLFARLGGGFDIVSGGELERVLAAGGDPRKTVFSGVGKSRAEIRRALDAGILCFNVESEPELERINEVAGEAGCPAPISIRVNPDVDAKTHPYIATGLKENKFGVPYRDAPRLYRHALELPHVRIHGIDCHIGSQLTDIAPFAAAVEKILDLADRLQRDGVSLSHFDLGGGLGIRYRDETPPPVTDYARAIDRLFGSRREKILIEPGRAMTGNAGLLLARVEYVKRGEDKNFLIVDAAMNDLMRPSLYDAWHDVRCVKETPGGGGTVYDVVGPVCESGDFLARDRQLDAAEGDLIAIMSAGAYGMSMSSNYNTRPRAAEVMVDDRKTHLIRERESIADLMAREIILP